MIVHEMTTEDCVDVLSKNHFAHLACAKEDRPYIVPIQYAFDPGSLYSFSMPGRKIEWLRANPHACVQVQEMKENREWRSVVVQGKYEELPDNERWHGQRIYAWSLLEKRANWWEPGSLKPDPAAIGAKASIPIFFAIRIESMTGRQSLAGGA